VDATPSTTDSSETLRQRLTRRLTTLDHGWKATFMGLGIVSTLALAL